MRFDLFLVFFWINELRRISVNYVVILVLQISFNHSHSLVVKRHGQISCRLRLKQLALRVNAASGLAYLWLLLINALLYALSCGCGRGFKWVIFHVESIIDDEAVD